MPPGANKLGDNRFALLSPVQKSKRKKPEYTPLDLFPELPIAKKDDPKYLIIKSLDANKLIASASCFVIYKSIQAISKEVNNISSLRDGSLLLLVKNQKIAEKFLATKYLPGAGKVEVTLHATLNSTKGTIYAPFICHLPEDEIIEGLKDQGVSAVHKFTKLDKGSRVNTGAILLTFSKYNLPNRIEVAWRTLDIRPYYPNPMRCKNCNLLGHTAKRCNNTPSCVVCNLPPNHPSPAECPRVYCANCAGEHPSSSNACPKYVESKEILKIKTIHKCTMREAITSYKKQLPSTPATTTFARVANTSTKNDNISNIEKPNNISPTCSFARMANTPTKNDNTSNLIKLNSKEKTSNQTNPNPNANLPKSNVNNNSSYNNNPLSNKELPENSRQTALPSFPSLNPSLSSPFSPTSLSSSPTLLNSSSNASLDFTISPPPHNPITPSHPLTPPPPSIME